jgi:manganese/zinc/iron transport system substrate-binding protein
MRHLNIKETYQEEDAMRSFWIPLNLIGMLLLLAACGGGQPAQPAEEAASGATESLGVLATTQQIAAVVTNVAGDTVELTALLGPGIDPHTYVATESDIRTFENADIIFYNGHHLEARLERVFDQMARSDDTTVIAVAEQIEETRLLSWEPEAGLPNDPHIWNDVRLWKEVVQAVADTLAEADPAHAETYQDNAEAYIAELDELHEYILAEVEQIPQEQRVLVTAHDAFGYYGRAYGLAVEAVQGLSTETEASTADVQALADIVAERNVPAIFIETTISPRTIEAVQEAVRAETGREVNIGGELYSDAMGEPGTPEGTYIGMMRHNTDTIVSALSEAVEPSASE